MARATLTAGSLRGWQGFDPFRIVFGLLTSVRVALLLLAAVAIGALVGVIFPQAPDDVRAVPASYAAFTEFQRTRYGVFTTAMRRLGVFEVFHSYWFNGLILLLLLAVAVCTANRIPPIVRNFRRPVRRVNDRYFQAARHRAAFSSAPDADALVHQLRKRRYRVRREQQGDTTYLFADRFAWAQFGTFVSHLALILFMAGAIVTKLVGFSTFISIAQGRTDPVFPTIHAGQMQVQNLRAGDTPNSAGIATRYFSDLAVYRGGSQICRGTSTVNNPMHCAGYTFHQTTFSPDGVELRVRDLTTGQLVYSEVDDLDAQGTTAPSPRLQVRDASGDLLFDDNVVLEPESSQKLYAVLPIPAGQTGADPLVVLVVGIQDSHNQWTFSIYHPNGTTAGDKAFELRLLPGQSATENSYSFSIPELHAVPLGVLQGLPGIKQAALVQLATSPKGQQYLDVLDMGSPQLSVGAGDPSVGSVNASAADGGQAPSGDSSAGRFDLQPNVPFSDGQFEYTFLGVRSVTGITVRRDPGSMFIWVATGLLLLGLAITFYLPRRRLWAKVTPEQTVIAGIADRIVNFSDEMRRIGAAAGSPDALVGIEEED